MTSSSDIIGPKILNMLGIQVDRCIRATIHIEALKSITVEAEYYPDVDPNYDTDEIELLMKNFTVIHN